MVTPSENSRSYTWVGNAQWTGVGPGTASPDPRTPLNHGSRGGKAREKVDSRQDRPVKAPKNPRCIICRRCYCEQLDDGWQLIGGSYKIQHVPAELDGLYAECILSSQHEQSMDPACPCINCSKRRKCRGQPPDDLYFRWPTKLQLLSEAKPNAAGYYLQQFRTCD